MKIKMDNEKKIPEWLYEEVNNDNILAKILYNRGINSRDEVKKFLDNKNYKPTLPNDFPNMQEGVKKIVDAIDKDEKIMVYGDYDVDGITSTTILVTFLQQLGAKVDYHIPDRFEEGYGMNKEIIKNIKGDIDLILSCDCGISNYEEVRLAKELGIDVIITDHHDLPDDLPPADIILTPKFFNKEHRAYSLPGAGMAYYLVKGIINFINNNSNYKNIYNSEIKRNQFLDLLALAIIADVVPLKEENRYLLKKGLKFLKETERKSLNKLFELSGINKKLINEEDIAFRIAPILNAAGRMENADIAVEMFLARDEKEIEKLANKLIKINSRRKEIQQKIIEEAEEMIKDQFSNKDSAIILYQPHWHEGLLGIAAGRLAENYNLPALLMTLKEDGKTITGSARSIEEIHINNKLKKVNKYLIKYGGHAGAAGFSLQRDQYTIFKKKLSSLLEDELSKISREESIKVDAKINLNEIDIESYYSLRKLAPFGEENPKPLFITKNCQFIKSRSFSNNKHKRLVVEQNNVKKNAIWWWAGEKKAPEKLNLIYNIDLNRFRGKENIQLTVKNIIDAKESGQSNNKYDYLNSLRILDYRNWKEREHIEDKLSKIENAVYYQEGSNSSYYKPVIDRYGIGENNKLVLISFPPSLSILNDLIYNNEPSEIILAFNKKDLKEKEGFIKRLTAILKYILKEKNGKLKINEIAVLTGELEITVEVALKYLKASGYLNLEKIDENNYFIDFSEQKEKVDKKLYKNKLKSLLKESMSFNKFLLKTGPGEILDYVKS